MKKTINSEFIYQTVLILIIFCLYSVSINYPFYDLWDDLHYIINNKHISLSFSNIAYWFSHQSLGCYIPVTMFSYMVDYSLWGYLPFGYHLQNIIWHIVATIALYHCFRLFNIKPWLTFFACIIFTTHPQRVESVIWISERKDVLCTAFYFLSIYFYIRKTTNYSNSFNYFPWLSFAFFIFAILSKPMAISLPIILLIYEWHKLVVSGQWSVVSKNNYQSSMINDQWEKQRGKSKEQNTVENGEWPAIGKNNLQIYKSTNSQINIIRNLCDFKKLYPYFIILLIFIPIIFLAQGDAVNNRIAIYQRAYIILFNIYWYTKQTLLCSDLNPMYPLILSYQSILVIALFYIGLLMLGLWLLLKKRINFIFCYLPILLCYFVSLAPAIGFVRLGGTDYADRYSYIPSAFILFGIALLLNNFLNKKNNIDLLATKQVSYFFLKEKFIITVLGLYLIILVYHNYQYQKIWRNQEALFSYSTNNIKSSNINAITLLAGIKYSQGKYIDVLNLSYNMGEKLPLISSYFHNMVLYYFDREKAISSILQIEKILEEGATSNYYFNKKYINILCTIIDYYQYKQNKIKAIEYIDKILNIKKIDKLNCFYFTGLKYQLSGQYKTAIKFYKKALKSKPDNLFIKRRLNECIHNKNNHNKNKLSNNKDFL